MTDTNKNNNNKTLERLGLVSVEAENRLLSVKLNIAHAFISMWLRAYDALLSHQVNVRDLPEYRDQKLLDEGLGKGDLEQGRNKVLEYIKRVESGIMAAIRRKSMRRV